MDLTPYLNLDGQADAAITLYQQVLGAEVEMLLRMKDNPDPQPGCGPADVNAEHVMHCSLKIGNSRLMISDCMGEGKPEFKGVSLSLVLPTEAEVRRVFEALAKDGKIEMPLGKTFFAEQFGVLNDRFGVSWMLLSGPQS